MGTLLICVVQGTITTGAGHDVQVYIALAEHF